MNEYGKNVEAETNSYMNNRDSIDKEVKDIQTAMHGVNVRGALAAGIKKSFDISKDSQGKAIEAYDVMEAIMKEGFDNAALESNFSQKLDDEIANLQPKWTQFKDDTENSFIETMNYMRDIAVNASRNGFKGVGTEEDTNVLNDIIAAVSNAGGGTVYIPSLEDAYLIHIQTTIKMADNVKLHLDINTKLKATPTGNSAYSIIDCRDTSNIEIIGGHLIGERHEHNGESGEWGHGINLQGATDYIVKDIEISNCWGDGIYIGPSNNKAYSEYGLLERVRCIGNRRNGLSITSVKGLIVLDSEFSETNGTAPASGVDIEPNSNDDFIEGVKFINPVTKNNEEFGIVVGLDKLSGSGKDVDITIENHNDNGSGVNFSIAKAKGGFGGIVNNIKPQYFNAKGSSIYVNNYFVDGAKINVENPFIKNPFKDRTNPFESGRYGNVINIIRDNNGYTGGNIGNVHINNPTIIEEGIKSFASFGVWDDLGRAEKISFINPLELSNKKISNNEGYVEVVDEFKQLSLTLKDPGTTSINKHNIVRHIDNSEADGTRLVFLNQNLEVGTKLTITVKKAHKITVSPAQGEEMRPLKATWVQFESNRFGTMIEIEKVTKNLWMVKNVVGVWENLNDPSQ